MAFSESEPRSRRLWRTRLPAPIEGLAEFKGFEGVRLSLEQAKLSLAGYERRRHFEGANPFNILAISGGAAGGAFGAGALVGLTQAGRRPTFAMVTGVSTGALIAPFAFLGPSWDGRLREAYTGGYAAQTLNLGGVSPVLDSGLFRDEALERLICPFVDDVLVQAVAEQHCLGRRLLVATTDLDRQKPCIWDMGEIATRGGEQATRMFRDVLIASSSLPGLFPPRRFACEVAGSPREELHVDGGVSSPLFVLPQALAFSHKSSNGGAQGQVFVIVNTVLEPTPRTTTLNLPSVLIRSFDTMLRVSYRQALTVVLTYCAAHNLPFNVASIPDSPEATENGGMLSFDTDSMRATFDSAVTAAQCADFWRTSTVGAQG